MARVLIVDDAKLSRLMLKKMVVEVGHETIEATDGKEGLEKIINEKPDIAVIDLLMPEMGGTELLSTLQNKNIDVPVIVVSSNIQDTIRKKCLELGAAGFINKPPAKEELQKLIEDVLNKRG